MRRLFAPADRRAGARLRRSLRRPRDLVPFRGYDAGAIVVVTGARQLYYVIGNGQAIRYPVGVGRAGMAWHGHAYVAQKLVRPAWSERPGVTPMIPGG